MKEIYRLTFFSTLVFLLVSGICQVFHQTEPGIFQDQSAALRSSPSDKKATFPFPEISTATAHTITPFIAAEFGM